MQRISQRRKRFFFGNCGTVNLSLFFLISHFPENLCPDSREVFKIFCFPGSLKSGEMGNPRRKTMTSRVGSTSCNQSRRRINIHVGVVSPLVIVTHPRQVSKRRKETCQSINKHLMGERASRRFKAGEAGANS